MQGTVEGGTQGTVEAEHTGYRRGRGRHSGTVEEGIQAPQREAFSMQGTVEAEHTGRAHRVP